MKKKYIIQAETLPYKNIFDLTAQRLDLIQSREGQIKVKWEITARLKEITTLLNEIDEKLRKEMKRIKGG